MDNKVVLIAAAAVAAFYPQIFQAIKLIKAQIEKYFSNRQVVADLPPIQPPTNDQPDPAAWVNELYALQQTLLANDRKDAASLVGEAIIELVNTTGTKTGGNRK